MQILHHVLGDYGFNLGECRFSLRADKMANETDAIECLRKGSLAHLRSSYYHGDVLALLRSVSFLKSSLKVFPGSITFFL